MYRDVEEWRRNVGEVIFRVAMLIEDVEQLNMLI